MATIDEVAEDALQLQSFGAEGAGARAAKPFSRY
jgi:hypothetical protein